MFIGLIYKVVLFVTLIYSYILGRRYSFSTQKYLFLYLLITFVNEFISFIRNIIDPDVKVGLQYNFYFIFCILYFSIYFLKLFSGISKILLVMATLGSLAYIFIITNFLGKEFDNKIGITITLFYITISLLWFYHKILFFDKGKITGDPAFWVSTGLLMWSCFFLFRVTPMFYFAKEDEEFLNFLKIGQNFINIGMYVMFYISLKQYKKISHESH